MTDLITVEVYKYDFVGGHIPTKADEFMEFWQDKLKLIPDEFMESALINIDEIEEYGASYLSAKVTYKRPKTDEKIAHDRKEDSVLRGIQEAADLRHLARLKAKYPQ